MINGIVRRSAATTVPAVAATAGSSSSSDEMLVARIADGDKLAMQVLFARHRTYVYRWLFRFVGNETVAEDLLSDVFFDVWQQAGRFEGGSAVSTWLPRSLASRRFRHAVGAPMRNSTRPSRPPWPTPQTMQRLHSRRSTRARCCAAP